MAEKDLKKGTPAIVTEDGNKTLYQCGKNAGKKKVDPGKSVKEESK